MRIHLDTDLGGDPDDVCALAMLLGWPGVEITGITTNSDPDGLRAAYVEYCLQLGGRDDIPIAAGAGVSMTRLQRADPVTGDEQYWPTTLTPRPSLPGAALNLIHGSIDQGAVIIGIGAYTNLALLEIARPGSLGRVPVVVMGGWIEPPADDLPVWGPEMDWNVQFDTHAAEIVFNATKELTLVTLAATMRAHLTRADLPRLHNSGPLGDLIARQSEARWHEAGMDGLGRIYAGLPDDLLNFHYDPVACAVALGWSGAEIEEKPLRPVLENDVLRFQPDSQGRPTRVVVEVDGDQFRETWFNAVEAAQNTR
jgi:inosine-uridine nucleoside N-ribohydrolase